MACRNMQIPGNTIGIRRQVDVNFPNDVALLRFAQRLHDQGGSSRAAQRWRSANPRDVKIELALRVGHSMAPWRRKAPWSPLSGGSTGLASENVPESAFVIESGGLLVTHRHEGGIAGGQIFRGNAPHSLRRRWLDGAGASNPDLRLKDPGTLVIQVGKHRYARLTLNAPSEQGLKGD